VPGTGQAHRRASLAWNSKKEAATQSINKEGESMYLFFEEALDENGNLRFFLLSSFSS